MPGGGSIQLARILGIRIGVNTSWFVVLFFFIFLLSGSFRDTLDTSDGVAYMTAVASALLFFVSLVLHELGHAVVARRQGIGISGIDLWFFGGIARMNRDTRSPGEEFKVAIAGPLVTLAVVALCVGAGVAAAGSQDFRDAIAFRRDAGVTPGLLLLSWLATINGALFVFNLVPAFPLDGGRIARAIAWRITGERLRATRAAAMLGRAFSYVLIGFGIVLIAERQLASGLWMMALGWFLGQAARGAIAQTVFSERIEGVTVADIMDREPVAVPAAVSAARALEEYFLRYRWPWFPVTDAGGRFVGLLRREQVDGAESSGQGDRLVAELMEADDGGWHIRQDTPLERLLAAEGLRRAGALMAVDREGVLTGVVTVEQVRRALEAGLASGPHAG